MYTRLSQARRDQNCSMEELMYLHATMRDACLASIARAQSEGALPIPVHDSRRNDVHAHSSQLTRGERRHQYRSPRHMRRNTRQCREREQRLKNDHPREDGSRFYHMRKNKGFNRHKGKNQFAHDHDTSGRGYRLKGENRPVQSRHVDDHVYRDEGKRQSPSSA